MSGLSEQFLQRLQGRLSVLYGPDVAGVLASLEHLLSKHQAQYNRPPATLWSEQDCILITYGDSLRRDGEVPLQTLSGFLQQRMSDVFSALHILPFFPFSSDDGFSVIDYRQVNDELGDWNDITELAQGHELMVDLVINHASRQSLWFIDYINQVAPAKDYFIELEPETDVSEVTRPRNTPLLVPVQTHQGVRYVWATFSEDQMDLNFANPAVLIEIIDILLFYISQGARFIRLDAIAYLWKKLGTRCIHLPQTHEVVKLLRDVVDEVAPGVVLITETNVPNLENLSYFGEQDEAHMVYQFSLPPLLLHAVYHADAQYLTQWAQSLPVLPAKCTFFNFCASHDGIGLRPAEGLLPERDVQELVEAMHRQGGFVSMRSRPDGTESPYEINVALFDAVASTHLGVDQWQVDRFLVMQAIVLALRGVPGLYIHSLTATPNDLQGVESTGRLRSINRRKWELDELVALLDHPRTPNAEVFNELTRLIKLRRLQPAFHPDAAQQVLELGAAVFGLRRESLQAGQCVYALHNLTPQSQTLSVAQLGLTVEALAEFTDLVTGELAKIEDGMLEISPYQIIWLAH